MDRQILALCAPTTTVPPARGNLEAVVERAAALDVFPLVFHRLRQDKNGRPAAMRPEWEKRFRANAVRNLYLHNQQQRLLAALAAAGVRAAPLKGTTLAELAYGDLALRSQADLDLYVPPRQLPPAVQVLEACNYQRVAPLAPRPEQLAATGDEFTSECSLQSTGAGMPVPLELHWRLLPMADEELHAALAPPLPGRTAASHQLPPELNFLYLCLRASAQRWARLKLLADLAHWVARQPPDWEQLLSAANRLRLRRLLYLTLAALRTYFDTPVPEPVRAPLESAQPWRLPPAAVANPFAPPRSLSPAATHRLRLALREDFRDRLGYAAHLLRPTASDLAAVRLPRSLSFLYWGMRWLRVTGLLNTRPNRRPVVVQ